MILHKRARYCPYCQSHKIRKERRNAVQKYILNTQAMYKCGSCEKKFTKKASLYRKDIVNEEVMAEGA